MGYNNGFNDSPKKYQRFKDGFSPMYLVRYADALSVVFTDKYDTFKEAHARLEEVLNAGLTTKVTIYTAMYQKGE